MVIDFLFRKFIIDLGFVIGFEIKERNILKKIFYFVRDLYYRYEKYYYYIFFSCIYIYDCNI